MSRLLIGILAIAAIAASIPVGKVVSKGIRTGTLGSQVATNETGVTLPPTQGLVSDTSPLSSAKLNKLTLESRNTYVFRGPVSGSSVGKAIQELSAISRNTPKNGVIYLVLDTPGGSVIDGLDLIDFIRALPQEVRTVTLFAASMGFQIAENNPGRRLITTQGILMSHRAAGGVQGQFDGELESEYKVFKRKMDYLETKDATRMGITLAEYKAKIKDELWVNGFDSVSQRVADEEILLECGQSLTGTSDLEVESMFGSVTVTFDNCPLIRTPVAIKMPSAPGGAGERLKSEASEQIKNAFYDQQAFVKDVIVKGRFNEFFK